MSHTSDFPPNGARSAVVVAAPPQTGALVDPPPLVVPTQPAPLDLLGFDDAPLEQVWPPLTAWWLLGGDSD